MDLGGFHLKFIYLNCSFTFKLKFMEINLPITATKIIFYRNKLGFSDQINLKCDVKGYIILRCLRYKEHASCTRSTLTACARGMIKTHNMELFRPGQHAEAARVCWDFRHQLRRKTSSRGE